MVGNASASAAAAIDDLPLAADVDDPGAEGDTDAQRHQQQRGGLGQRLRQAADGAERALQHRAVGDQGIDSQQQQQDRADSQRQQRGHDRQQGVEQFVGSLPSWQASLFGSSSPGGTVLAHWQSLLSRREQERTKR